MNFELLKKDNMARAGKLTLNRGQIINTPVFMPVGTQATIKTLDVQDMAALGIEMMLSNAYHLYLRPGSDLISTLGGIHKFMNWPGGIITDSGGFQVFSLAKLRKVKETGIEFSSHLDGSKHLFTPEKNMEIQHQLGADIIMALDVCVAYPSPLEEIRRSVQLTFEWAKRCKIKHECLGGSQSLFGIIQGGVEFEGRIESTKQLLSLDLPGYGIGGLSVGEGEELMNSILQLLDPLLPENKPRYLMGVGTPVDLWNGISNGIDMFDCVMPSRIARNGTLFTSFGRLVVKNACYVNDELPPDPICKCFLCTHHSRAYLRHLFNTQEITALRLSTLHNLSFMLNLSRFIRETIMQGRFEEAKKDFLHNYLSGDRPD